MTTTTILTDTTQPQTGAPEQQGPAGQQQYAQQPTQAPSPAAANPENTRVFAIVSFVLGIASIVSGWTFIAPIAGLVLGILALRRGTSDRTLALWGVWLNGVMLALTSLAVLFGFALIGFGLLTAPFLVY